MTDNHMGYAQNGLSKLAVRVLRFLGENERLLVVAASTMIMSLSHTALRPVLPTFAKVGAQIPVSACATPHTHSQRSCCVEAALPLLALARP